MREMATTTTVGLQRVGASLACQLIANIAKRGGGEESKSRGHSRKARHGGRHMAHMARATWARNLEGVRSALSLSTARSWLKRWRASRLRRIDERRDILPLPSLTDLTGEERRETAGEIGIGSVLFCSVPVVSLSTTYPSVLGRTLLSHHDFPMLPSRPRIPIIGNNSHNQKGAKVRYYVVRSKLLRRRSARAGP